MKTISIFGTKLHPATVALLLTIFIILGMVQYVMYNFEYENYLENREQAIEAYATVDERIIESSISSSVRIAKQDAVSVAEAITIDIKSQFPDLHVLEDELNASPHASTPDLTRIIQDDIRHKQFLDLPGPNNSIFVISREGIVTDMNVSAHESTYRNFEEEFALHENEGLSKRAMELLLRNNSGKLIFYETTLPKVEDHHTILEPSMEELMYVFRKEGIEGLRGYTVLVPAYITDEGDIFGTPDISNTGTLTKNHKLVVVQRFNVYDVIKEYHMRDLEANKVAKNETLTSYDSDFHFRSVSYIIIMLLNITAILLMLVYSTTRRKLKEPPEE